jgi:hypothetical protein
LAIDITGMMNQYEQNQKFIFTEACKLASGGEEFSHLLKIMTPEFALRLKIYVQGLPLETARKTIYGSVVTAGMQEKKKRKRA